MVHDAPLALRDGARPLSRIDGGTIEANETYVGGRRKRVKGETHKQAQQAKFDNKVPVVALVNRETGKVRATVMPRVTRENLHTFISDNVDTKHSRLFTDDAPHYDMVGRKFFSHESVKHSENEYVRGSIHTNTVEGFFGILKRGITGVYHHVGKGHLHKYVDEFSFRYNARKTTDGHRAEMLVHGAAGERSPTNSQIELSRLNRAILEAAKEARRKKALASFSRHIEDRSQHAKREWRERKERKMWPAENQLPLKFD